MYRHGAGMKRQMYKGEVSQKVFLSVRTGFVTVTLTNVLNNALLYKSQGGEKRLSEEPRLVLRRNPTVKLTLPLSFSHHLDAVRMEFSEQLANDPQHLS
jgi:hypothetical protein